eukprot:3471780-Amphidinium_carterae.1
MMDLLGEESIILTALFVVFVFVTACLLLNMLVGVLVEVQHSTKRVTLRSTTQVRLTLNVCLCINYPLSVILRLCSWFIECSYQGVRNRHETGSYKAIYEVFARQIWASNLNEQTCLRLKRSIFFFLPILSSTPLFKTCLIGVPCDKVVTVTASVEQEEHLGQFVIEALQQALLNIGLQPSFPLEH